MTVQSDLAKTIADTTTARVSAQAIVDQLAAALAALQATQAAIAEAPAPAAPAAPAA
jgi:hypothetical protein